MIRKEDTLDSETGLHEHRVTLEFWSARHQSQEAIKPQCAENRSNMLQNKPFDPEHETRLMHNSESDADLVSQRVIWVDLSIDTSPATETGLWSWLDVKHKTSTADRSSDRLKRRYVSPAAAHIDLGSHW